MMERPSRIEAAGRRLEATLEYFRTWVVLALVLVLAAVVAGIATTQASPGNSGWAAGIYMWLLGATLLAVLWYSLETRRLVRIQREVAEIQDHPWLKVRAWPHRRPLPRTVETPFGGTIAYLPILNVGRTPALFRSLTVEWERMEGSTEFEVILGTDLNPRVLAPGQDFVNRTIEIRYGAPTPPRLLVNVSIAYRTVHGASGRVMLRFRFADGTWKSRDTDYERILSSGQSCRASKRRSRSEYDGAGPRWCGSR